MYSQTDHYRRLAIAAKLCAAQATDPSARTALEEVANHWIALAEQVEWLSTLTRRQAPPTGPSFVGSRGKNASTGFPDPGKRKVERR
jgi:hypothetical protein